ncbi:MAG: hypothetical protein ACRC80_01675, partial [Waterburya sp.]
EEKALALLAQNVENRLVASALGVSESLISQWISRKEFSDILTERRFKQLAKHTDADNELDELESTLRRKLKQSLVFLNKPLEIASTLAKINAMERRGISAPALTTNSSPTVNLQIPLFLLQNFTKDSMNQVVEVGDQSLVTIQSSKIKTMISSHNNLSLTLNEDKQNDTPSSSKATSFNPKQKSLADSL